MAHIVITSGPTRQFLDPVRYLTNASSGRMGAALAQAALDLGHIVTIVSGPVQVEYPVGARVLPVITTEEMLEATRAAFETADGLIGAAAPCDYRPIQIQSQKMSKIGQEVMLRLVETPDIVATLGASKRSDQWVVGFALETEDQRFKAIVKMQRKCCDMMVSNGPKAIDSTDNDVEVLDHEGNVLEAVQGSKESVATRILLLVQANLIQLKNISSC
jgi:phosphopantothenoylcysteine decarboxylase / phosphopantothenate---cysteine ligase